MTAAERVTIHQTLTDDEVAVVIVSLWRSPRNSRWVATYNIDFLGEHTALRQARDLAATFANTRHIEVEDNTR